MIAPAVSKAAPSSTTKVTHHGIHAPRRGAFRSSEAEASSDRTESVVMAEPPGLVCHARDHEPPTGAERASVSPMRRYQGRPGCTHPSHHPIDLSIFKHACNCMTH